MAVRKKTKLIQLRITVKNREKESRKNGALLWTREMIRVWLLAWVGGTKDGRMGIEKD